MRLLIDANGYLNPALLRGVDHDGGRVVTGPDGKQTQVNGWQYGVDGFWEKITDLIKHFEVAPRQCILVWDGANAKAMRRSFIANYKGGRDKAPEVSEQLNIARERCNQMALHLGMHIAKQDGMEADDVLDYLRRTLRTQRNIVCTGDGDMAVQVDENTQVYYQGEINKNPFGPFPHKHVLTYKSLVGDGGDKIPGAKGFGDTAFVDFVRIFGLEALDDMLEMIENDRLHELKDSVQYLKSLQKIIDDKDGVACSWRAARLYPERVNTMRKPLGWQAGMAAQWRELDPEMRVDDLRNFYGTKTLVTAANFNDTLSRVQTRMDESPLIALDIETSESDESIEWVERLKAMTENERERFDTLGHELAGMSLTFGANTQHTIYMSVDHKDTDNITVDQCRQMCEVIPQGKPIVVQNRHFEFTVLYRTWGEQWKDNGWHGFLPNCVDTKIGASYVDENFNTGLKGRSLMHLGYKQATFEETMRMSGPAGTLKGGRLVKEYKHEVYPEVVAPELVETTDPDTGEIVWLSTGKDTVTPAVTEEWETRQYRMNEVTADHVFDYGCDDTICTAALHTHYQLIMELEHTWNTYMEVEQLPEYLTSLAFVQGFPISLTKLREMEKRDDARYDAAWVTLREYLMQHGWPGTVCPEFDEELPLDPSDVRLICEVLVDTDEVQLTTRKRKLNGMASDIRTQFPDDAVADIVAAMVEKADICGLNKLLKDRFTGEPKIKFNSPKQMQNLFYRVIGIKPRIFNKLTAKQKEEDVYQSAFKKMRKEKDGKSVEYSGDEWDALISKASTDDAAVEWALAKDPITDVTRGVLDAYRAVRTILTRRSLFYRPYKALGHWSDGRLHPTLNQFEAATGRYSSSNPNIQQMPARGDGAEFRCVVQPHHKDAVIVSCDFSAQEIRCICEQSGDAALTACYVGENLFDVHSLTAVQASHHLWDTPVTYPEFMAMLESDDSAVKAKAKGLRASSKTVRFASLYGAQAPNIAQQLMIEEETAQKFLEAQDAATPRVNAWKQEVEDEASRRGYALDLMGVRRHLAAAMISENKWDRARAARQASNFAIQGSSAAQTKLAMSSMWRSAIFTSGRFDAKFYFPVHDECVASVHRDQVVEFVKEFHGFMVQPFAGMKIPIVSSIEIGRSFGDLIECGEVFNEARIQGALDKIFGNGK